MPQDRISALELPGGLKFEFQELERAKQEAKAAGLVDDKPVQEYPRYAFLEFAESNPNLALAGLRMELEKSLKTLAERKGIKNKQHGIAFLMRDLHNQQVISNQEKAALADMITTLDRAVHGEEFDYRTAHEGDLKFVGNIPTLPKSTYAALAAGGLCSTAGSYPEKTSRPEAPGVH